MRDTKEEILFFWFKEVKPQQWFQKNSDFDNEIRTRYLLTYEMAADGLCDSWVNDADGCLALCLLLDQFPRRMFRGTEKVFATDMRALEVAKHALIKGFDQMLPSHKRRFLYLPYEHSEKIEDHDQSVELFREIREDDPISYKYALRRREIIERFGRFPHRNSLLRRSSTEEEQDYLAQSAIGR